MSSPSGVTSAERKATIQRARAIRIEMSEVLARLQHGTLPLSDALNSPNPNDALNRLYVVKVLESVPGVGKVMARRVMSEIGIAEKCRVHELETDQRAKLIRRFTQ